MRASLLSFASPSPAASFPTLISGMGRGGGIRIQIIWGAGFQVNVGWETQITGEHFHFKEKAKA